jgi:hypothetical protein
VISARGLQPSSNGALPSARRMKPRARINTIDAAGQKRAREEPIGACHVEETVGRPPYTPCSADLILGRAFRILGCRDACRVASGAARHFLDLPRR